MKKLLILLLVICFAMFTFTACTPTAPSTPDDGNGAPSNTPDDDDNSGNTPPDENEDEISAELKTAKQLMADIKISLDFVDEYNLNEYDSPTQSSENVSKNSMRLLTNSSVYTVDNYKYYTKDGYYDDYNCLTSIKYANKYTKELGQNVEEYMKYLNDVVQAFDTDYYFEFLQLTAKVEKISNGCIVTFYNPYYRQTVDYSIFGNIKLTGIKYVIELTTDETLVKINYDDIKLDEELVNFLNKEWVQQTLLLTKENGELKKTEFSYYNYYGRIKIDLLKTNGSQINAVECIEQPYNFIQYNIINFKNSFAACINLQSAPSLRPESDNWFGKEIGKRCWTIQFFYKDDIIYKSFPDKLSVALPATIVDGWDYMQFNSNFESDNPIWDIYGYIPNKIKFSDGQEENNLDIPSKIEEQDRTILDYMPVCSLTVINADGDANPGRGEFVSLSQRNETLTQYYQPFFRAYGLSLTRNEEIQEWFDTTNQQSLFNKQIAEEYDLIQYVDYFGQYDMTNTDGLFIID